MTPSTILQQLREDYIRECNLDILDPKRAAQIRAGEEDVDRKLEPVAKEGAHESFTDISTATGTSPADADPVNSGEGVAALPQTGTKDTA